MPKKFSPELRERAVRMVLERQAAEGEAPWVSFRGHGTAGAVTSRSV